MLDSADDVEPLRVFHTEKIGAIFQAAGHSYRRPEVTRNLAQILKSLLCHTDDLHWIAADGDFGADDIRAARKQILPRCVTEDYNWMAPGRGCVFRQQSPAQRGANAKHLKVVAGDQLPLERMAIQTAIEILNRCYFGESGVVLFELLIFAPGKRVRMTSAIRPGEAVQAIRVAQGNWTK